MNTLANRSMRQTRHADVLGAALPPLLVQAEKLASTVIMGVHGRRAAGPGESFWQYRPYSFGDSTQRVDWHRSARADGVFIRENEWENANTLWLWANTGPRMDYQSHLSSTSKSERAQLIALALASLTVRGHERVGALGSPRQPGHGRAALLRVAEYVCEAREAPLPAARGLQRRAAALLVSDFLDPLEDVRRAVGTLANAGMQGHIVQIADPAEETLPFEGRIEFVGLDLPATYLARKTQNLRADYVRAYAAHRAGLRQLARAVGWSFIVHRTDDAPARCVLPLHQQISGNQYRGRGAV